SRAAEVAEPFAHLPVPGDGDDPVVPLEPCNDRPVRVSDERVDRVRIGTPEPGRERPGAHDPAAVRAEPRVADDPEMRAEKVELRAGFRIPDQHVAPLVRAEKTLSLAVEVEGGHARLVFSEREPGSARQIAEDD